MMHRKNLYFALLLLVGVCQFLPAVLQAQDKKDKGGKESAQPAPAAAPEKVSCHADAYYLWAPEPPPPADPKQEPPPQPPPLEVLYRRLTIEAADKSLALEEFTRRIASFKSEAMQACRREHEDNTGCIDRGLEKASNNYTWVDYRAREALLEALKKDCLAARGRCLSVEIKDDTCSAEEPIDESAQTLEGAQPAAPKEGAPK